MSYEKPSVLFGQPQTVTALGVRPYEGKNGKRWQVEVLVKGESGSRSAVISFTSEFEVKEGQRVQVVGYVSGGKVISLAK